VTTAGLFVLRLAYGEFFYVTLATVDAVSGLLDPTAFIFCFSFSMSTNV